MKLLSGALGLGVMIALTTAYKGYSVARTAAHAEKPADIRTKITLAPGEHTFHLDVYTSVSENSSRINKHTLLFLRKGSGELRAFFLPLIDMHPALPSEDGISPLAPCESFEIITERERIECAATNAETRQKIFHSWSWDGVANGPFTPQLKSVAGNEKDGWFVFTDTYRKK